MVPACCKWDEGICLQLNRIRQIFREEVGPLSISSVQPVHQTVRIELTEEQKEENRKNVLADLDMFG